ncbi:MAG: GNAT family N-acetyltransferase [Planctomycetaceae bacterium]|nr:GNAT family N-acetyltransferase [Planctomycetaceae bacterium]
MNTDEKTPSPTDPSSWSWARARELEGTLAQGKDLGVWGITYQRIIRGWGWLGLAHKDGAVEWPIRTPPSETDERAKPFRTTFYYRANNAHEVLDADARNHHTTAAFRVTEPWRTTPQGLLDFNQSKLRTIAGHNLGVHPPFFLSPCPREWRGRRDFLVSSNTWGRDWGNGGWAAISYDFFDREMYEAWTCWTGYDSPPHLRFPKLYGSGIQHVSWSLPGDSHIQFRILDIVDADTDNRLAWGFACVRGGEFCIEEIFVKPQARRRGFGTQILRALCVEAMKNWGLPIRVFVPWADVNNPESIDRVVRFLRKSEFGFDKSPVPSAPFCALFRQGSDHAPAFKLPPIPAAPLSDAAHPTVNWGALKDKYEASTEFALIAQDVFAQHAETLKRLA